MLQIDQQGMVVHARIVQRRFPMIERTALRSVSGIIVHQTNSSDEQSVFTSYRSGAHGAHFLIAKSGVIYQTASVKNRTNHVGPLRARCLAELRCLPAEFKISKWFPQPKFVDRMNRIEMTKSVPFRYPSNFDSVGIEIVGLASLPAHIKVPPSLTPAQQQAFVNERSVYEQVTAMQNASLQWLVDELTTTLDVKKSEIFRHPDVSRKNPTEASTATWR